jgi:uncharacterized protein
VTGRLLAGSLAVALASCRPAACPAPAAAPASAGPGGPAPVRPRVTIDSPSGRSTSVEVEVARTEEELQRGLMFREGLGPRAGMLFLFADSFDRSFWMKNTLIPLDMIFIDEKGTVVGIVERAEPLTLTERTVGRPSRYVLEVEGGFAAEHGIRAGDRVRFEGLR